MQTSINTYHDLRNPLKILAYTLIMIGYLPMDKEGAHLFFQWYPDGETGSTIFTSNRTWGEILGDNVIAAAVLDKVLHHSITVYIKGENYRLKSRRKVGLSYPPPGGSN